MIKINNKKGMFFSIMVVSLILFFIISFRLNYSSSMNNKLDSIEHRVDSMNKFIRDISEDFNRAVYIAGYRALLGINEYITTRGTFISESDFSEAIISGTINGYFLNISSKDNLDDWKSSIELLSNDFMIFSNITFLDVRVYQDSPWDVTFEVDVSFYLRDLQNVSYYILNKTGKGTISIINFEDPFHSVFSNGTSISVINKTMLSKSDLIYDDSNPISLDNFKSLVLSKNYVENPFAPSYLNRLLGNTSQNKNGIESFILVNKLEENYVYSGSIIDYLYWSKTGLSKKLNISGIPYIALDDFHIDYYNLSQFIG